MIGRIRGQLLEKKAPQLLVDVQGVAYELDAPMTTFYQLPEVDHEVILHTHLVVREDAQLLYGFASLEERALFRLLIKISGVGAKLALTILSGMSAGDLARCVAQNDAASLVKLPGVGKKTAERLIIEMRDKLKEHAAAPATTQDAVVFSDGNNANKQLDDAVSALVALGYKPAEANRMVRSVDSAEMNSEEIIRLALKGTAKA